MYVYFEPVVRAEWTFGIIQGRINKHLLQTIFYTVIVYFTRSTTRRAGTTEMHH